MLSLVLVGELLAVALAVNDRGLQHFDWRYFGMISFLLQWIILTSAACLCPLRPWFRQQNSIVAGSVSYGIVLFLTLVFTAIGQWLETQEPLTDPSILFSNLIIAAVFAGVVLRYFYIQQQLHNQQQAELQARVQALQSRIRPHFLFNSMNSIASLIDINPSAAEKMVVDLSQLFRASLNEATLVPLTKELDVCERYIAIEQFRLGDRLVVKWTRQDFAEEQTIPSLLLQPLIENAIYHGIQPSHSGGEIDIKVELTDKKILIEVENTTSERKAANSQGHGMALDNIRNRLAAHYGDDGELKVRQTARNYIATVSYPAFVAE